MVLTGAVANNIFRQLDQIQIAYIHHQSHCYFGLIGIGNVGNNVLTKPLLAPSPINLATSAQEVQNLYDRVHSYMIYKAVEELITKTYLNNIRLHRS